MMIINDINLLMCLRYIFNYIDNVYNIMFYTLISKSFIKKTRSPRDYLYIFLAGSIGYVSLHWYLYMDNQTGIKQTIKHYLYYTMILDAFIAYSMLRMYTKSLKEQKSNTEEPPTLEYTPEQKLIILQKSREARRIQQQTHKEQVNQELQEDNKNDKEDVNDEIKESKPSIFTKSEESNEESSNKKTSSSSKKKETIKVIKKTSENVDDTEIPVYKKNS